MIRRTLRLGRELRAQRGLFSQLEAALSKQPGCVVLGVVEWERGGRVVALSDGLLGLIGYTHHSVTAGELGLRHVFTARALALLANIEQPPTLPLEAELLARTRAPLPVLLCFVPAVAPHGHTFALVLGAESLNLQLRLDALILGIVSHELRTPLGVISMAANLLLSDDISSAQRRTVQRVASASRHSDRLVSDLLDFTAARGAGITLLRAPRDLHVIAGQALDDVRDTWPGRAVEHERSGLAESYVDEDRIAQIIVNLVNNALQHSPPATKVFVQTRGESAAVILTVTNFGSPIPAEEMAQLFSPMRRGESAGKRRGSLGLGLFIVRHLVEAHDASIEVISNETQGTRFTIRFPHPPPSEA